MNLKRYVYVCVTRPEKHLTISLCSATVASNLLLMADYMQLRYTEGMLEDIGANDVWRLVLFVNCFVQLAKPGRCFQFCLY